MKTQLQFFLNYLIAERTLSGNTVSAYQSDLTDFLNFIEKCGIREPAKVDRETVHEYLSGVKDAGMESSTIARRLVAIKMFFRFLSDEKLIDKDVTAVMDSPKLWSLLPDFLSSKEVELLLKAFPSGIRDPLLFRNRVMLELLYASGLRVSELTNLPISGIDFETEIVRVTGKGSKTRIVPVGKPALKLLKRYLELVRPQFLRDNPNIPQIFLSRNGRKLNRERIWAIVKEAGEITGIHKNIHPHTLRHSFASHLLANGADLRVIQEMLGHADIGTTEIYTHVDQTRLAAVHKKYHPRH